MARRLQRALPRSILGSRMSPESDEWIVARGSACRKIPK